MVEEYARNKEFYPDLWQKVYAPRWYYSKEVKNDNYSRIIFLDSKIEDKSDYFFPYLKKVVDKLYSQEMLDNFELLTIIPSHEVGKFSPTMDSLALKLSNYLNILYEQIISRIRNTRQQDDRFHSLKERYYSVKDSMLVKRELAESSILLLDDIKTTGTNILETKKLLWESGVKRVMCICLGINSSKDRNEI
jgi:predicted amidophosphoribosyltransferase